MGDINIAAVQATVLWSSFAISMVFGFAGNRANFCTMGAIADIMNMGDWTRMRMWALAAAVAIIGTGVFVWLGWLDPRKTLYTAARLTWLSFLVGGVLFGIGMVLASGCGSKTLIRVGGGSLKSLVVFVMLGLSAFATMKGVTAVLRVDTVDRVAVMLPTSSDLPSLLSGPLGMNARLLALVLALVVGGAVAAWALASRELRAGPGWWGGLVIGACVVAVWYVSARVGYVAEDPNTLQEAFVGTNSGRAESLTYVAPMAYTLDWLLYFSDKSKTLTLGIMAVIGTVLGSWLNALVTRTFRWESFRDAEDLANHLVGGVLMGVGGVTALGCTIGQGITGVSTLAVGSFIATAGIVAGGVLGVRYQVWRLEHGA
ncbi:MAG: YeeE/YedE family protein [Betaproteobacteria bacterium]|nr:YeeE/YedE family protein [Betaproteobacteria bacterium]MDE2046896.1 YeeE/YedE family protein [Betaproteobacteria bacterium]